MPVPQTLAKKLNKDVFQEGGREAACILSGDGRLRRSPGQRRGEDGRLCGEEGKEETLHQV